MFWLVESKDQFNGFCNSSYKEAFVEVIPYNNWVHPTQNHICAIYIRPLLATKGFIIPISHSETLNINIDDVTRVLSQYKTLYVRDKKEFLHYFVFKTLLDITLTSNTYIQEYTQTHSYFYSKMGDKTDVNRIIPIVKHYEYCENMFNNLKDRINEPINNFYNNKATLVFNALERSGLRIDREKFESYFHNVNSEYVYTQYNFKTLTGRPSNKFKGVNYAALNKDNGSRECFIPRNDNFIEFDIGAYHPTLLAKLVGYDFGDKDVHMAFAEMYGVDYKKAKELTFKQLYGGVFDQYKDLEFFKKVQVYTDELWEAYQENGWIESPISGHQFIEENLEDMKPQKLLNYVLQNLETATNVCILWDIIKLLKNRKTKLVLYTYDSFLFDFSREEKDLFNSILDIFKKYKLQIKYNYGDTYDFK
jgi:hypothetical protein